MSSPHTAQTPGRNDPCPCGSGRKYKKCHGANGTRARPVPAGAAQGQGVEQRFAQAYQLFQQGAFAPAADVCTDILRSEPDHVHANHLLGLCRFQQGRYQEAAPYLERVAELAPMDPNARNILATTLGWLGKPREAEAHARRAVELDPNAAGPKVTLGKILIDLGRLPDAAAVLEQALTIDSGDPDSWYAYGKLHRTERRFADARAAYERVLSLVPDSVHALNELGLVLKELKDYDGAFRCFERARRLMPNDAKVLLNLGGLAMARGEIDSARELFEQVITVNDRYGLAYLYLWELATHQEDWNEAVRWLVRGATMCPENREIHEQLAVAYAERQEFPLAYEQIELAVHVSGATASTELARAVVCDLHHDREAAVAAFRHAMELDPHDSELLLKFAAFEERNNRLEEATDLASRALALDASCEAEVRILLARIERRRRAYDRALAELTGLDFNGLPTALQTEAWFELGALRDAGGEYAKAFDAYTKGAKAVVSSGRLHFDPEKSAATLKHYREVLTPNILKGLARFTGKRGSKRTPIFVVGFMRSGTTLMEQILSSHPDVQAGDELVALPKLTQIVAGELGQEFPDCLVGLDRDDTQGLLAKWREQYIDLARHVGVDAERGGYFTDKNNLNLLYLPFITMLFPESPIVHIRRNPMDCVFSNFVTNPGFSIPWAYNLEHAAAYYRDVMAVTEYYRDNMAMRYHEIQYEDLVAEPDPVIREVAEFVGLTWDDGMLRFYENKRIARTPSHAQVNQTIYTRSVERYRHYEEFLAKPLAILEPLMQRYGYLES